MLIKTSVSVQSTASDQLLLLGVPDKVGESYRHAAGTVSGTESVATGSDGGFLPRWMWGLDLVHSILSVPLDGVPVEGSQERQLPSADSGAQARDLHQVRLETRLGMAFDAIPIEDGISHPADQIINQVLRSTDEGPILEWLRALCLDAGRPVFAASVLQSLIRQEQPGNCAWRADIVRSVLAIGDIEMRDAAAQAAEMWGGSDMRDVLMDHTEPVEWLRNYTKAVIKTLAD